MIISHNTFLSIDNPHAIPVDIGIAIKPIPVRLKVIELDVVAIITKVSNDFNIVIIVAFFIYFFGLVVFIFEICNQFFNVVNRVIKTVDIIFLPIAVQYHSFLLVLRDIIYLFFVPFI